MQNFLYVIPSLFDMCIVMKQKVNVHKKKLKEMDRINVVWTICLTVIF